MANFANASFKRLLNSDLANNLCRVIKQLDKREESMKRAGRQTDRETEREWDACGMRHCNNIADLFSNVRQNSEGEGGGQTLCATLWGKHTQLGSALQ